MRLAFDFNGQGPVVVLLHGFPLDRTMWRFQRSSLEAGHRVIVPDLRGHGASEAPDGIFAVDAMADDVLELLDTLRVDVPVVLGGLSMGGYVALSVAVRHPDRVRGLMLMNSRAAADTPEGARVREELARQVEVSGDVEPVVALMIARLFARSTFENQPEVVAGMHAVMSKTPARSIASTLRGLAVRPDRTADLPGIQAPTLVLAGAEDQLIPFEESERIAGLLPRAKLVKIADAGHLAPLENPRAANAAILEFLASLD